MARTILMIDDDMHLTEVLKEYLGKFDFRVLVEHTPRAGMKTLGSDVIDLVILDVMLPEKDGIQVCKDIRQKSDVPILMLTARGDMTDRIVGLEMGADDYLPKPFEPRELLARLRAILRRAHTSAPANVLQFGRLEIDKDAREVRIDGAPRTLTSYQFALMLAMAERAGRVLSRDTLFDLVKGESIEAFDRSIDVHISLIRAAIEDNPKKPRRVITVRGAGYVFAKAQE